MITCKKVSPLKLSRFHSNRFLGHELLVLITEDFPLPLRFRFRGLGQRLGELGQFRLLVDNPVQSLDFQLVLFDNGAEGLGKFIRAGSTGKLVSVVECGDDHGFECGGIWKTTL